jgi:hypothetical protein
MLEGRITHDCMDIGGRAKQDARAEEQLSRRRLKNAMDCGVQSACCCNVAIGQGLPVCEAHALVRAAHNLSGRRPFTLDSNLPDFRRNLSNDQTGRLGKAW